MGDAVKSFGGSLQLGVTIVIGKRVAAGRHKLEDLVEALTQEPLIGRGARHFAIEAVGVEGVGASRSQHMLREHVERARPRRGRVLRALRRGFERRLALDYLEAVGGDE